MEPFETWSYDDPETGTKAEINFQVESDGFVRLPLPEDHFRFLLEKAGFKKEPSGD